MLSLRRFILLGMIAWLMTQISVLGDAEARVWTAKSGDFSVSAEMVSQDNKSVTLKKSDGRVITVPLQSLSDADRDYLKNLSKEEDPANPFAGGKVMEQEVATGAEKIDSEKPITELSVDGHVVYLNIDEPLSAIAADPGPKAADFHEFARPLEDLDAYARISPPILVNPKGPVYAVSTHRNGNIVNPANFGRIYLIQPDEKRPEKAFEVSETFRLFDHHVDSNRAIGVVGVNSPSDRGGDLVLLSGLGTGDVKQIAQWHLPEWQKPGFKPKVEFAKLIDGQRAIVRVNYQVYCWDLETGECHFLIDRVSSGKAKLSGSGRYLALPVSRGCQIVDCHSGELLGKVPFPSNLTPTVEFSPDGTRLAMVGGNQFAIWNLANAGMEQQDIVGNTLGGLIGWIDEHNLLTQFALLDLQIGRPVWSYHLSSIEGCRATAGGVMMASKSPRPATLMSLPIPHPTAIATRKKVQSTTEDMLLLHAGSSVSLKIDAVEGVDTNAMEAALKTAVERAGWKVEQTSAITVTATISRDKKQTLSFRTIGSSLFAPRKTVSIRPYRASLSIEQNGKSIWSRSSQNMVPFLITRKSGESLKEAVKKYEVADPQYFERVTIPPKIFKTEYLSQIGSSRISNGRWADNR